MHPRVKRKKKRKKRKKARPQGVINTQRIVQLIKLMDFLTSAVAASQRYVTFNISNQNISSLWFSNVHELDVWLWLLWEEHRLYISLQLFRLPTLLSSFKKGVSVTWSVLSWSGGRVTDGLVVRADVSVTWSVLLWSGRHEFEPRSCQTWDT